MMRTRMLVLVLTVLFVTAGVVHGATIPLTGSDSRLETTSEGVAGIGFQVEVGLLQTLDVDTKGGSFTRIFIPGFHTSRIEGEPELPMLHSRFPYFAD